MKTKAVIFSGQRQVEIANVSLPELGPKDILVEIMVSGVSSGTEGWILKNEYKTTQYPLIPGYQAAGVVSEIGNDVESFVPGTRVHILGTKAIEDHNIRIMWGGHIAYAVVNESQAIPLPEGVSFEEAALARMIAVAIHGIDMTGICKGDLVLVIGQGLIGQMVSQVARIKGGRVIASDILDKRVELSNKYSSDIALNPKKQALADVVRAEKQEGTDVIIDTSANAGAINASFELIRKHGRYCLQGYYPGLTSLDLFLPHVKEITFYNPTDIGPNGVREALQALAHKQVTVKPLVTHEISYKDVPKLYVDMIENPAEFLGILIRWNS